MPQPLGALLLPLVFLLGTGPVLAQEDHPELRRLMEADQAVREGDWSALSADSLRAISRADSVRQVRVRALLAERAVRTGADHYHAALVLQHGNDSTAYRQAFELSREAAELGYDEARWLVPRAYDRWQLSIGKPQVYGTQFVVFDGTGNLQEPHDLDAVSDEERVRWGLAPKAAVLRMHDCLQETGDFRACAAARDAALDER